MSDNKLKVIAEISKDIGQVFFASVFIGPLVTGNDNYFVISSGLLLAVLCWSLSLIVLK